MKGGTFQTYPDNKTYQPLTDDLLRGNEATANTTVNSALGDHLSNVAKTEGYFIAYDLLKKLEE